MLRPSITSLRNSATSPLTVACGSGAIEVVQGQSSEGLWASGEQLAGEIERLNSERESLASAHDHLGADRDALAAWLRARRDPRPLCLFVGTNWPHVPWPATGEGYAADAVTVPANHVDTPRTREARATYYAAVGRMDRELGEVFDAARKVLAGK